MSRSSNNGAKGAVFLALLLLAASPAGAQTPNPPGGSSGGGGSGCTTAGSNGDVLTDNGTGGCNSDGNAVLTAGALGLGSSGVEGSVTFGNATTGTITLQPVAGALGTVTASLPANSGTLAELNLAQSWPAVQTFASPVLNGTVTGTGVSQSAAASTLAQSDTNSNIFGNNFLANATLTVGSGGTTTLTAASSRYQALSTAAQTYVLPDATTLSLGPWFAFNNNSSGALTINKNGGTLQYTVPAGGVAQCGPTNISTAAGSWDCHAYVPSSASWGTGVTGLQMNNVLSTTAQIGAGASSCTAPNFIPQRGASTTGFGGAGTNICGAVGGVTTFTSTATAFNIPTGASYQINGSQITCTNLSGGCTLTVGGTTIGSGTANGLLYDNAGVLGNLATANNGVLVTSGTGAPSISTTLPDGLALGTPGSVILTNATGLPVGGLASIGANTIVANVTGSSASPTAVSLPSCSTTSSAIQYTSGTGFGCGTSFVTGPASVTSGHIATFNGTTGKILQDGGALPTGTVTSITCFGVAITTSGTCTTTGQIPGAANNTPPSAGNIGEPITLSVVSGSAVSLTNNTPSDIGSIPNVTAGRYWVCATIYFTANSATVTTNTIGWLNTTSATIPTAGALGSARGDWNGNNTGPLPSNMSCTILSINSTQTLYLSVRANFTVNTLAAYGKIEGYRIN